MEIREEPIDANGKMLWGICYRMTGDAAEADDIVQETFLRAMANSLDLTEPARRPWLVRVAINLSRDHLRQRRRRGYTGVWLPSPVFTDDVNSHSEIEPIAAAQYSPSTRYELKESITLAFLLVLEALTPTQRAVLLLRDVFDYSTQETAELLEMTEVNVKVTLLRARRIISSYDKTRVNLTVTNQQSTRQTLEAFLTSLQARDITKLEQLLTDDVVVVTDSGGEVSALRAPISGKENVLRLTTRINELYREVMKISFASLNGLPALIVQRHETREGHAKCFTLQCDFDPSGKIAKLNYVFSPTKLKSVLTKLGEQS